MKTKILCYSLITFAIICIMASLFTMYFVLSNNEISFISNKKNNNVEKENNLKVEFDNIQSLLDEIGIETEKQDSYYQLIGAIDGYKLNHNDLFIEVYKYDKNSDEYKKAEETQSIEIKNVSQAPAIVKNGYAYIINKDFPQYDKVVNILNQLK